MILSGTPSQIEWASSIRLRVDAEFDRVANAFRTVAEHQSEQARSGTLAVIALLEEKRAEVMSNTRAGYFIQCWQELNDQVRKMIADDPRYKMIKQERLAIPI